jgi:ornithine carbamoyltransferase
MASEQEGRALALRLPLAELQLQGRDFLTLADFSAAEVSGFVEAAARWKAARRDPHAERPLSGRSVACIFLKPSLRTRVSCDLAITELGGHAIHLAGGDIGFGHREPFSDIAHVLERFVDGVIVRGHVHEELEELARHASVPVINALTARFHPLQALADLLTLRERFGRLAGVRLAFVGDGNNVAQSLMLAACRTGMHFAIACPQGYEPEPPLLAQAEGWAADTGGSVRVVRSPAEAAAGADAVYTDVWVSMGQAEETEAREAAFAGYVVDEALMRVAAPHAVFMHDLPAHRGLEVAASVIDGPRSVVFEQAENRLHAAKAVLAAVI